MTVFSWSYGFEVINKSLNLVAKYKRLFVYMLVANLIAAGVLFFIVKSYAWNPGALTLNMVLFDLCSAFFMVPLIYSVVALVHHKQPAFYTFYTVVPHAVTIAGYVFLLVASKLIIMTSFMYLFKNNVFAADGIVPAIILFLVSLLYYFVLVVAVVEQVGFIAALQKSFAAVKFTLYSIIGGAVWWNVFIGVLYIVFVFGPVVLLFLLGAVSKHLNYFFKFNFEVHPALGVLLVLAVYVSYYTLYYTVYGTFQTLLYLAYKNVLPEEDYDDLLSQEQQR